MHTRTNLTLLAAPILGFMGLAFLIPLAISLIVSVSTLQPDNNILSGNFSGLENYRYLFSDERFTASVVRTLQFTFFTVLLELLIGFYMAHLLDSDLPLMPIFRTLIIIPMIITPIVGGLTWKLILDPTSGLINWILGAQINWLGHPRLAPFSVSAVNIWQNAPFVAVIILAGLRSIPRDLLNASKLDGASNFASLIYIKIPLVKRFILTAVLLRTIFEMRSFDNVYIMTSGGPADSTMLMSFFVYTMSFTQFDITLASAASWIMLLTTFALCAALGMVLIKEDHR